MIVDGWAGEMAFSEQTHLLRKPNDLGSLASIYVAEEGN